MLINFLVNIFIVLLPIRLPECFSKQTKKKEFPVGAAEADMAILQQETLGMKGVHHLQQLCFCNRHLNLD